MSPSGGPSSTPVPVTRPRDDREGLARRERRLVALAATFAVAIFVADLFLPLGVAGGAPYTVLVLLGLWSRRRAFIPTVALAATVLTVAGALLSPPGVLWVGAVNRVLTILAIGAIAAVLLKYDRTRRALIRSRKDARAYFEVAEIILVVLDRDGRIQALNRKGGQILECDPREVIGRNWFEEFLAEPDRTKVAEVFNRMQRGEVKLAEYHENRVLTRSGRPRVIAWHNAIVRDDQGQFAGTLSSGEDVTERRRFEEVSRRQDALARLGQMAAMIAHEVRNPIAGVSGAIQILERRLTLKEQDRDVLRSIVERLDGLDRMSGALLKFSRPRTPSPRRMALQPLLREAAHLIRSDPGLDAVDIRIEGDDPMLRVDGEQMGTVFLNLFLNAADAMDGSGVISVSVEKDKASCWIRVRDRGKGIPVEQREQIFEPFFTTKSRGTGLGLAIARQVVEAHGGDIIAEFPEDGGTRFVLRLPES